MHRNPRSVALPGSFCKIESFSLGHYRLEVCETIGIYGWPPLSADADRIV